MPPFALTSTWKRNTPLDNHEKKPCAGVEPAYRDSPIFLPTRYNWKDLESCNSPMDASIATPSASGSY